MYKVLFLLLLMSSLANSEQKQLKVAVVDTGLDLTDIRFKDVLCKEGHKDFTHTGLDDNHGHGTHIAGLIKQFAAKANYCLVILKYFDVADQDNALENELTAFQEAINLKVDVVNFSGGGPAYSEKEFKLILAHPEIKFIVSAGNNGKNLDLIENNYYPASHFLPNIIVVGNLWLNGSMEPSSNYGKKLVWEIGYNVLSSLPKECFLGYCKYREGRLTGTSMSTAIHTGKYIHENSR